MDMPSFFVGVFGGLVAGLAFGHAMFSTQPSREDVRRAQDERRPH